VRVFVSYRWSDSPSAARQLADALKGRFGEENVFFDTKDLRLGGAWRRDIERRIADADIVVAVIGPRWMDIADERGRRRVLWPEEEDVLRTEVETALRDRRLLVPVLVDDAVMPSRDRLPRPLKPLAGLEAATLRHGSWTQDVEALLAALPQRLAELARADPEPAVQAPAWAGAPAAALHAVAPGGASPDLDHYLDVTECLADGTLVPMLGSGAGAGDGDAPWEEGCGRMPAAEELARALARRFRLPPDPPDLARVAQHITLTRGPAELHRALRQFLLRDECEPTPVDRFLARVPRILRQRGEERFQLIITTNYDTVLERAFNEVHEPFDLAVFMATGEHRGRFLHVPWWDVHGREPRPITVPNEYVDLPIDDDGELERTVIVKIHGGVLHDAPPEYQLRHNFVITEDDYIGYLSRSPVESLVPLQILNKLRESHFLFLEYAVRDWNLRVFLRRIWADQEQAATSWSVQRRLDRVDRGFWEKLDVERYDLPVSTYVEELERRLTA
jgi:hypothetical protein